MTGETKNILDVLLTLLGMVGAVVAFNHTIKTWREGQRWRRAEELAKFIEHFEASELLRLATVILDWTSRKVVFMGNEVKIMNDDVLVAAQPHGSDPDQAPSFSVTQALIRDALDAFLSFLGRLESALQTRLIDAEPTRQYFAYWLERLVTMDRHLDEQNVLKGVPPALMMRRYVTAYSDIDMVTRLCLLLKVTPPERGI